MNQTKSLFCRTMKIACIEEKMRLSGCKEIKAETRGKKVNLSILPKRRELLNCELRTENKNSEAVQKVHLLVG